MKNKLTILIALLVFTLAGGCTKAIYTIEGPGYELPGAIGAVPFDDTHYDLFVRTVSVQEEASIRTLKVNAGTAGKLIEIEYLFISKTGHNVIYISTVADRYKSRYSGTDFPGIRQPNVADLRVFLVGTFDQRNVEKFTFYYPDGEHTDTWWLHKQDGTGDRLLRSIEQKRFTEYIASFPLEDGLGSKLIFKKQSGGWQLIFREAGNTHPPETITAPVIQFGKPGKKSYTVAFKVNDRVITFPKRFMIYSPEKMLEQQ